MTAGPDSDSSPLVSLLTCPLLTSVLCHHRLPQQQKSGMHAYSLFREQHEYSLQLFRQSWQCLFELSNKVLLFIRFFTLRAVLKSYQPVVPYGSSRATWNSSTCRSHIWGPWLETWQFGIDQVGYMFGICQFLCPFIVWFSVPFLCVSKGLCVHPAFMCNLIGQLLLCVHLLLRHFSQEWDLS